MHRFEKYEIQLIYCDIIYVKTVYIVEWMVGRRVNSSGKSIFIDIGVFS